MPDMLNVLNAQRVKKVIARYGKDAKRDLDAITTIESDRGRTAESKQELVAQIRARREQAFTTAMAEIERTVTSAAEHLAERAPSAVQRRAATMTVDGAQRAAALRALLSGAPTGELIAMATAARSGNDKVMAHTLRLEIAARLDANAMEKRDAAKIVAQLAFPLLVEQHEAAMAGFVSAKVLHARFVADGPLLDPLRSDDGSPVDRLNGFRRAATAPTDDGDVRSFTQPQIERMMQAVGVAESA